MRTLYVLLAVLLAYSVNTMAQDDWKLEKQKEGISIFNRKSEGSKLKEFKGVVRVKASVQEILTYINDASKHEKFMYKCKRGSVKVVKKVNPTDFYTYMVIETPWPASERDVITHYSISKPDKTGAVTITLRGVPDLLPQEEGKVRVPMMKGYWKLVPLPNGETEIIHQALSAPGGNVPESLANSASVDAPFSMLLKLKELVEK
jgi:hypothetical protein